MAQNNNKKQPKKAYKNPTKSLLGKILICILAAAMGLASLGVLIYYIVNIVTNV